MSFTLNGFFHSVKRKLCVFNITEFLINADDRACALYFQVLCICKLNNLLLCSIKCQQAVKKSKNLTNKGFHDFNTLATTKNKGKLMKV